MSQTLYYMAEIITGVNNATDISPVICLSTTVDIWYKDPDMNHSFPITLSKFIANEYDEELREGIWCKLRNMRNEPILDDNDEPVVVIVHHDEMIQHPNIVDILLEL